MRRWATLSAMLGLLILTGGFVAFSTTDQAYGYSIEELDDVPEDATVFSFDNQSEDGREFIESLGISPRGHGYGEAGIQFPESRDPRDLIDLYSDSGGLRGDGTVISRNGSLYRLHRSSLPSFWILFLLPKYLLIAGGSYMTVPWLRKQVRLTPLSVRMAGLVGVVGFSVVEWFGNDWLYHLPSLGAGIAAVGLYLYVGKLWMRTNEDEGSEDGEA